MGETKQKTLLVAAVVGLFLGASYILGSADRVTSQLADIAPAAGNSDLMLEVEGPLSLISETGEPVDLAALDGYKLLFFGFTHCPDVCPTGLQKIAQTLNILGTGQERITPVFVTVDPARDTPEVMAEYTDLFHPDLLGLTGSEEQIKTVMNAYKAYASAPQMEDHSNHMAQKDPSSATNHEAMNHDAMNHMAMEDKTPEEQFYQVDHSAYIYFLNDHSDVLDIFGSDDSPKDIAQALAERL